MPYHRILNPGDIHIIHNFEYADEAERTSALVDGYDIGKVARQLDDDSFYILQDTTPTWLQLGAGGGITATEGADGYIAFFTGSDSIAGDNDLFWDRANNRLGIGTTTPTFAGMEIDVNHDTNTTLLIRNENAGAGAQARFQMRAENGILNLTTFAAGASTAIMDTSTARGDATVMQIQSGPAAFYSLHSFPLFMGTNNSMAITIDTSQNVGIGIESPSEKLHVAGNIKVDGAILNDDLSETFQVITQALDGYGSGGVSQTSGFTGADGYIAFFTGDGEIAGDNDLFWDRANNRLGVGSTAPDGKVHISRGDHHNVLILEQTSPNDYNIDVKWIDSGGSRWITTVRTTASNDFWFYNNGRANPDVVIQDSTGYLGLDTDPNELLTVNGVLSLAETTSPSDDSGWGKVFVKASDSKLYFRDDGGTEYDLTTSSGGVSQTSGFTGADGYVAFFTGDGEIAGDDNLFFDRVKNKLIAGSPQTTGDGQRATIVVASSADRDSSPWHSAQAEIIDVRGFDQHVGGGIIFEGLFNSGGNISAFGGIRGSKANDQDGSFQGFLDIWGRGNSGQGGIRFSSTLTDITSFSVDMAINSEGKVGINTETPHEALTVNGIVSLQEQDNYNRTHDGYGSIWASSDGTLKFTNDAGTEFDLTATGGGGGDVSQTSGFTGADGYLAFWTGSNEIAGDNDLFYKRDTGNLGIGTSSPDALLHIVNSGTAQIKIDNTDPGDVNRAQIIMAANGARLDLAAYNTSDPNTIDGLSRADSGAIIFGNGGLGVSRAFIGTENAADLHLYTGNSIGLTIDSSQQVGIGTTGTISTKLQVAGNIGLEDTFDLEMSDGTNFRDVIRGGSTIIMGDVETLGGTAKPVIIRTGGGDAIRIGTDRQVLFTGGSGAEDAVNAVDVNGNMAVGSSYAGSNTAPSNGMIIEGSVGIGSTGAASKLDVSGNVTIGATYAGAFDAAPTNGLIVEGEVGLGTNSPDAGLHYVGTFGEVLFQDTESNNTNKFMRLGTQHYSNSEEPFFIISTLATSDENRVQIGGGTSIGNAATGIAFRVAPDTTTTTGTEIARFTHYGLGINTIGPHEALTVNGIISLQEQDNYNRTHDGYGSVWAKSDGKLYFTNDSGTEYDLTATGGGGGVSATEGADGYLAFFTGSDSIAGDNDLSWNRVGNYLEVRGTEGEGIRVYGEDGAHIRIVGSDQSYSVTGGQRTGRIIGPTNRNLAIELDGNDNTDRITFITDPGNTGTLEEVMVIQQDGTVGIGETAPTSRLEVASSSTVNLALHTTGGGGDATVEFRNASTTEWVIGMDNSDGDKFKFGRTALDNTTAMTLTQGQRVGIGGNISPASTLDVVGNVTIGSTYAATDAAPTDGLIVEGNVGIGIASPDSNKILHIQSDGDAVIKLEDTSSHPHINFDTADATSDWNVGINRNTGTFVVTYGDLDSTVVLSTNTGGNVGIGNNNPHEALTVSGVVSLQEQADYTRTHDGYGSIWAKSDGKLYFTNDVGTEFDLTSGGGGGVSAAEGADGYLAFFTGSDSIAGDNDLFFDRATHNLTLTGGGRLGIGTDSPTGALEIARDTNFAQMFVTNSSDTFAPSINIQRSRGTLSSQSAVQSGDQLGVIGFRGHTGSGYQTTAAIVALATQNFSGTAEGTKLQFEITNDNTTTRSVAMTVDNSGNVGIGRTPSSNALEVEGDASKTSSGSWSANSDAKIKTNVRTIEGGLDLIKKLRPVAFQYNEEYRSKHKSIKDSDYYNFIAQEYMEIFPTYTKNSGEDDILQIDTDPVKPYLVAAVQELAAKMEVLEKENKDLKERLDKVEKKK